MSISSREITVLVQGLFFLVLTVSAARQFSRRPGQVRFHTLLIYASATGTMLLEEVGLQLFVTGTQDRAALFVLRLSGICGLFTLYAIFLLTGDLTSIRRWLGWIGIGILILGGVLILLLVSIFPSTPFFLPGMSVPVLAAIIFPVFFGSSLFITICFWYSSALASGAIRRRLQWLGASGILACFSIALALGSFFTSQDQLAFTLTGCLLLSLASTLLYLGSAPPGWLRRFWMLPELERASRFCNARLLAQTEPDAGEMLSGQITAAINRLLQYSMQGFGALVGIVQVWNEERGMLEVAASILPSEEGFAADAKSARDEALAEVFRDSQARLRPIAARKWPFLQRQIDSGMVMVAPLKRGEHTLGVIGLCCEHAPIFTETDLSRLQLFADQITCLLTCHWYQEQLAALTTLRQEQSLKDEFIAVIAHDLRTPLTVFKGRLQLLRRQLLKEGHPDAAEAVAKLDAPYTRLSQLITTLLDVSYIDTGRLQLLRHPVDLLGVVRKVVAAYPEREITLEVQDAPSQQGDAPSGSAAPLIVLADAGRLEQVLGNLLDNARKYSPVESKITVRVGRTESGAEALLSVQDQGIGIAPEDQPRLFERWFRPGPGTAQNLTRPGLGLYISHEIVARHGGRLWVESSGIPGKGSTFFFTSPLIHPEQVTEASNRTRE
jgi:signal transduction histidine kinase